MLRLKSFGIVVGFCLFSASSALGADAAVLCVQQELNALGFNSGRADGVIGGKTFTAGEDYRAFMVAKDASWQQPALIAGNAAHWCEQVAKAHPNVLKYWTAYNVPRPTPISCVQNQLNKLGYSAGEANGTLTAETVEASRKYIAFMKANNPGWNDSPVTANSARDWCQHVAEANRGVAKYWNEIR